MGSRHPVNKLTALEVARLKIPGRYADGNNLYLLVEPSGAKRWVLRLTVNGRRRDMGFGNSIVIPLKKAREMAIYYKSLAKSGLDPILERKKEQGLNISFQICAENVFKIVEPSLKNKKFAKSWISSLERYAYFYIGKKPISQVTSSDILNILTPIWYTKGETARKIKQRLRMIFKWARAKGYLKGDNPVELAEQALPKIKKSKNHFKAIDFNQLPNLIKKINHSTLSSVTRSALEFTILSAARTTEVINALWEEIYFDENLWIIPPERMKNNQEHIVPLTKRMISILNDLKKRSKNNVYIFEGPKNKPISNNTMRLALQRQLDVKATIHGMRSSFKDWASETTNFGNEVSEMVLGHSISNKIEAAYRRGKLLDKRRNLMEQWNDYLYCDEVKVIKINSPRNIQKTRLTI